MSTRLLAATTALNKSVDWTLHPFSDVLSHTWRKVPLLGPVRCLAMGDGPARCAEMFQTVAAAGGGGSPCVVTLVCKESQL